jgi:hypothetical protein
MDTRLPGRPVADADLFQELVQTLKKRNVLTFFWHFPRERNQEADRLATPKLRRFRGGFLLVVNQQAIVRLNEWCLRPKTCRLPNPTITPFGHPVVTRASMPTLSY